LYGKILGADFQGFFLKNPSKLKNFWVKGGTNPPIPPLATRLFTGNYTINSGSIGFAVPSAGFIELLIPFYIITYNIEMYL